MATEALVKGTPDWHEIVNRNFDDVNAQLGNKVQVRKNNEAGLDCNLMLSDGRYQCQGELINSPPWVENAGYGHFFLEVYNYSNDWVVQIAHTVNGPGMYIRHKLLGAWRSWVQVATTNPPKKFALPLAAGFEAKSWAEYFKTQDEQVVVNFKIVKPGGISQINAVHIATLPVGFRPITYFPHGTVSDASFLGISYVCWVEPQTGNINVVLRTPIEDGPWCGFAGTITFFAGV